MRSLSWTISMRTLSIGWQSLWRKERAPSAMFVTLSSKRVTSLVCSASTLSVWIARLITCESTSQMERPWSCHVCSSGVKSDTSLKRFSNSAQQRYKSSIMSSKKTLEWENLVTWNGVRDPVVRARWGDLAVVVNVVLFALTVALRLALNVVTLIMRHSVKCQERLAWWCTTSIHESLAVRTAQLQFTRSVDAITWRATGATKSGAGSAEQSQMTRMSISVQVQFLAAVVCKRFHNRSSYGHSCSLYNFSALHSS